jgi:hypothetical protein
VASHPFSIRLGSTNIIRMPECARSDCNEIGTKSCSACLKEFYCGSECQKSDYIDAWDVDMDVLVYVYYLLGGQFLHE